MDLHMFAVKYMKSFVVLCKHAANQENGAEGIIMYQKGDILLYILIVLWY